MRMLHYLLPIALLCGLSGVAKAEDFQMVVIDPTGGTLITSTAFVFGFDPCAPGEVPGDGYQGCFAARNGTGELITSIQFSIPLIPGQVAGCVAFDGHLDLFPIVTCDTGPAGYLLTFSGGKIQAGDFFLVAEAGVAADAFPDVSAVINAPEPGSLWLLSTGILSLGFFFVRRQPALCTPRR
jgi:hypothetical protein